MHPHSVSVISIFVLYFSLNFNKRIAPLQLHSAVSPITCWPILAVSPLSVLNWIIVLGQNIGPPPRYIRALAVYKTVYIITVYITIKFQKEKSFYSWCRTASTLNMSSAKKIQLPRKGLKCTWDHLFIPKLPKGARPSQSYYLRALLCAWATLGALFFVHLLFSYVKAWCSVAL